MKRPRIGDEPLGKAGVRVSTGPDGYAYSSEDSFAEQHDLIGRLLEEIQDPPLYSMPHFGDCEAGRELEAADDSRGLLLFRALRDRTFHVENRFNESSDAPIAGEETERLRSWKRRRVVFCALELLLGRPLPLGAADLEPLTRWLADAKAYSIYTYPIESIARAAEALGSRGELSDPIREDLTAIALEIRGWGDRQHRSLAGRIDSVVAGKPMPWVLPGEAWSDRALADLDALAPERREPWIALLNHCADASGSKPSNKFLRIAAAAIGEIGREEFRDRLLAWLPLVSLPRTRPRQAPRARELPPHHIIDLHADILRGLAWCAGSDADPRMARALGGLALTSYKKVPGIGPRLPKVGNASVLALGRASHLEAVGQLTLIGTRVRSASAKKELEKALAGVAERLGISREDLEEIAIPTHGLVEVGKGSRDVGDFIAETIVTGTSSAEVAWIEAGGRRRKSVPASVRKNHPEELRELQQSAKEIAKLLLAHRDRIDQCYLRRRSWRYADWKSRYLDHPLIGTLSRRLIWSFGDGESRVEGAWRDGELVDRYGRPLGGLAADHPVALWHPLHSSLEDTLRWREWLELNEISQPYKQAHREIYLLTDAERGTRIYSNRFASHILRQHQFHALCGTRGWRNRLRLFVDDFYPPASIELPAWGLRAEFWVEGAGSHSDADLMESGAYRFLATDQVRFYPLGSAQRYAHAGGGGYDSRGEDAPLDLESIPAIVLSEVFRDVDLFVGVASLGNDPSWADGGADGRHLDYWRRYAFGDLDEGASMRGQVLASLIPRLKIADRCRIAGRYLVVRGELNTYKIHLRSGNILMEPDDRYLCIIRGGSLAGSGKKLFLPFEGDGALSLILSKAFLLADDARIDDATIVRQIRRS